MGRPWWQDDYWKKMDWRQERRMRTTCPFCGSDRTYYNEKFRTWKCLKCEKPFVVEDLRPTKDAIRARKTSKPKDEFVEHWERQGKPPTAYEPFKGISRTSWFPSWLKLILAVAILIIFTVVVWGLWGSKIAEFFSGSIEEGSLTEEGGSPLSTEIDLSVFDDKQPPYSKTFGAKVHLINNKYATDPTWEQLVAFLIRDSADQKDYSLFSYPCGAFAEEVHNFRMMPFAVVDEYRLIRFDLETLVVEISYRIIDKPFRVWVQKIEGEAGPSTRNNDLLQARPNLLMCFFAAKKQNVG